MPLALLDDVKRSSISVRDGKARRVNEGRKRRCNVDFIADSVIIEFDRLEEEQRENIWYSQDEYDTIKSRNSLLVRMMKSGQFIEGEDHSFRGLEHKLKAGFLQRRANKFNALNAVLEEQDRQYNRSVSDPDIIANAYRSVVDNARETACLIALRDSEKSYAYTYNELQASAPLSDIALDSNNKPEDIATDADTVCSDVLTRKKSKFRSLFKGFSRRLLEHDKMSRRSSV